MIVRILTDNQYRLSDQHAAQLDQLDDQLLDALDAGDNEAFAGALQRLIALVRENGTLVAMEEVVPSEVIIPADDMTLEETRHLLEQSDVKFTPRQSEQQA
jgi:hypothetical protein